MIEKLKNYETITFKLFGKETELSVISTGDNQFDESGNYKKGSFELNEKELEVLNWFIENVRIEDYKQEIVDYCNDVYSSWSYSDGTSEGRIGIEDLEEELNITSIAINVAEIWQSKDGYVYPEISFYGDCKCDEEHGICIGFRDKKFLGFHSQDWTL